MKHNILVLFAAMFLSMLAVSCGKKDSDMSKTDSASMPKPPMNMAMPESTPAVGVELNNNGNMMGVKVTAANSSTNSATFTVNNNNPNNKNFIYRAMFGPNSTPNSSDSSGTTGTNQWQEPKIDTLPLFWYVAFRQPPNTAWQNYTSDSLSTVTPGKVYFMSSTNQSANITVQITGGGGAPK